jgi:sialic acid synthase SpsE
MLILDMGSGNTCQNNQEQIKKMIKAVFAVDRGAEDVVLKWQLFKEAPPNVPLDWDAFEFAYEYAKAFGYETTASVFDMASLKFLAKFDVPFVKIACRPDLYYLAGAILKAPVILSSSGTDRLMCSTQLACVRKYPATLADYEAAFTPEQLRFVSDHTIGWELYNKYKPEIIEKHFVHERREGNPDAGPFAVTPEDLREVL